MPHRTTPLFEYEETTMRRTFPMSSRLLLSFVLLPALAHAQLPDPGLTVDVQRTAVVITDP